MKGPVIGAVLMMAATWALPNASADCRRTCQADERVNHRGCCVKDQTDPPPPRAEPKPEPPKTTRPQRDDKPDKAPGQRNNQVSYSALVERGDQQAEHGRCDRALELYAHALRIRPAGVDALVGRGYCQLDQNLFTAARLSFSDALTVEANHLVALWGLAEVHERQGRIEEAIAAYKRVTSTHPLSPRVAAARRRISDLNQRLPARSVARYELWCQVGSPSLPRWVLLFSDRETTIAPDPGGALSCELRADQPIAQLHYRIGEGQRTSATLQAHEPRIAPLSVAIPGSEPFGIQVRVQLRAGDTNDLLYRLAVPGRGGERTPLAPDLEPPPSVHPAEPASEIPPASPNLQATSGSASEPPAHDPLLLSLTVGTGAAAFTDGAVSERMEQSVAPGVAQDLMHIRGEVGLLLGRSHSLSILVRWGVPVASDIDDAPHSMAGFVRFRHIRPNGLVLAAAVGGGTLRSVVPLDQAASGEPSKDTVKLGGTLLATGIGYEMHVQGPVYLMVHLDQIIALSDDDPDYEEEPANSGLHWDATAGLNLKL